LSAGATSSTCGGVGACGFSWGVDLDVDKGIDAAEVGFESGLDVFVDFFGNGGVFGLDFEGDFRATFVGDFEIFEESEGDDVAGEARVFDLREEVFEFVGGHVSWMIFFDKIYKINRIFYRRYRVFF